MAVGRARSDDALAGIVGGYAPLDSGLLIPNAFLDADLAAIAALTTTSYGRGLLALANQAALRTEVGLELDYVQFTSPVSPTATSEATANTVVTGSAVAYDGSTAVMIHFFAPWARPHTSVDSDLMIWLYDGSSSIGMMGLHRITASGKSQWMALNYWRRLTPSAATHTFSIRASLNGAGTADIEAGAGGVTNTMPGYIRITRA